MSALVVLWQAQADELVAGRWDCIERVADALLERDTLTAAEVRTVILPPGLLQNGGADEVTA